MLAFRGADLPTGILAPPVAHQYVFQLPELPFHDAGNPWAWMQQLQQPAPPPQLPPDAYYTPAPCIQPTVEATQAVSRRLRGANVAMQRFPPASTAAARGLFRAEALAGHPDSGCIVPSLGGKQVPRRYNPAGNGTMLGATFAESIGNSVKNAGVLMYNIVVAAHRVATEKRQRPSGKTIIGYMDELTAQKWLVDRATQEGATVEKKGTKLVVKITSMKQLCGIAGTVQAGFPTQNFVISPEGIASETYVPASNDVVFSVDSARLPARRERVAALQKVLILKYEDLYTKDQRGHLDMSTGRPFVLVFILDKGAASVASVPGV
eukprot:tig00000692_g3196.t1